VIDMPQCVNCGSQVLQNETFCYNCGKPLSFSDTTQPATSAKVTGQPIFTVINEPVRQPPKEQYTDLEKNTGRNRGIVMIFLAIVAIYCTFAMYNGISGFFYLGGSGGLDNYLPGFIIWMIIDIAVIGAAVAFYLYRVKEPGAWIDKGVHGVARDVRWEVVQDSKPREGNRKLTFRLEKYSEAGDITEVIPVWLQGEKIAGMLREGDNVTLKGRITKDGFMSPTGIYNQSLRLKFTIKKSGLIGRLNILHAGLLGILAMPALALFDLMTVKNGPIFMMALTLFIVSVLVSVIGATYYRSGRG